MGRLRAMIYKANRGLLCTDYKLFKPEKTGQCIAVPKEWLDPERWWLSEVGQYSVVKAEIGSYKGDTGHCPGTDTSVYCMNGATNVCPRPQRTAVIERKGRGV